MYDRRYPTIHPIDRYLPGLTDEQAWHARLVGKQVALATGTRCFYNAANGKLFWCYEAEPHGGPLSVPFREADGVHHYEPWDIAEMIEYIRLGKMPRAEKERIAASNARAAEQEQKNQHEQWLAERRPDALAYAAFLDRRRRGTQKVVL